MADVTRTDPLAYFGEPTTEEMNGQLVEAAAPLFDAGFKQAIFTAEEAASAGLLFKSFLKQVRYAAGLARSGTLMEAVTQGVKADFMSSAVGCSTGQFINWVRWLKSSAGQKALYAAQQDNKLKRKAPEGVSVKDQAILRCFAHMKQAFAEEKKAVAHAFDGQIRDAKAALRRLEKKKAIDLAAVESKYVPVAQFVEPDEAVVANLAYELYSEEAVVKHLDPIHRVAGGLAEALLMKGPEARSMLERNHATQPQYLPYLRQFMEDQLKGFREQAADRQLNSCKHIMASIFGGDAVEEALRQEVGDVEGATSREPSDGKRSDAESSARGDAAVSTGESPVSRNKYDAAFRV